jgi:hypothetical protein
MKAKPDAGLQRGGQSQTIDRLYQQLVTWLYERQNASRAAATANRLARFLSHFGRKPESIFVEECRSLVAEARGDLEKAAKHRENEIHLIRRLLMLSRSTPNEEFVLRQYDYADLRDRLELLAMLYHANGKGDKAISALRDAERVSVSHGIRFDAEDLLEEYQSERAVNREFAVEVSENGRYVVQQRSGVPCEAFASAPSHPVALVGLVREPSAVCSGEERGFSFDPAHASESATLAQSSTV